MVLRVDLSKFPEAVKGLLATEEVFASSRGSGTWVTAGNPSRALLLSTFTKQPLDIVRRELEGSGLRVYEGEWSLQENVPSTEVAETWVAAVAYVSRESMPGLWMDAYAAPPTAAQVLKAMYDEFRTNGEMAEVTFEEFIRLASPNVQILAPAQIADFAAEKEGC